MERSDLEKLSRDDLVAEAARLGVAKPRVLTKAELVDEIVTRTVTSSKERAKARGWLGRARDLLASVVEKGLNLPEAARAIRSATDGKSWPAPPPPLPTVTLAEIYAAQGHLERAIATLDDVLGREPGHEEARTLRDRFAEQLGRRSKPPKAPAADATKESAGEASGASEAIAKSAGEAAVLPLDEDDALPDRYDVDEIVALAVDPRTVYVYWEVRPTTLARARAARPNGAMGIRLVSVVASWHGPESTTRDVRVDELYGERFLRDMTPGAQIRVSIGWIDHDAFEPFAVGMEVTAPRILPAENVAHTFGNWSATPVAPFTRATPEAAPFAPDGGPTGWPALGGGEGPRVFEVRSVHDLPPTGPHAPVTVEVIEEIRQRVLERLRRTGASELARERELVEERDRRIRERRPLGGPFGGASDRIRGGASERARGPHPHA